MTIHQLGKVPLSQTGRIAFESEDERRRYLVAIFPGLVKAGKFVEAMELVHGNERFNGAYRLFYKFGSWMARIMEWANAVGEKERMNSRAVTEDSGNPA